jgi:FKBP-type peptidyl-prolyl cis-trans isomerase FkpA
MISCGDDGGDPIDPIDYDKQNEQEIQDYIAKNNLNATRSNTGLYYVIETGGNGEHPNSNSDVTVNYKGYYTNDKVFDENDNISFNLQQVISGWTEGITYFKVGGTGMLLVPSRLGYGYEDYRGIPGGSVLIFDIDLLDVK